MFFFSSRRRHTSFSRDWSSDVCSSDLPTVKVIGGEDANEGELERANAAGIPQHYRGLDRYDARKAVLADLEAAGLLVEEIGRASCRESEISRVGAMSHKLSAEQTR